MSWTNILKIDVNQRKFNNIHEWNDMGREVDFIIAPNIGAIAFFFTDKDIIRINLPALKKWIQTHIHKRRISSKRWKNVMQGDSEFSEEEFDKITQSIVSLLNHEYTHYFTRAYASIIEIVELNLIKLGYGPDEHQSLISKRIVEEFFSYAMMGEFNGQQAMKKAYNQAFGEWMRDDVESLDLGANSEENDKWDLAVRNTWWEVNNILKGVTDDVLLKLFKKMGVL